MLARLRDIGMQDQISEQRLQAIRADGREDLLSAKKRSLPSSSTRMAGTPVCYRRLEDPTLLIQQRIVTFRQGQTHDSLVAVRDARAPA